MSLCNKITIRFLTNLKETLIKESDERGFSSLSEYLRYIIDNRKIIMEVKNEKRRDP